MINYTHQMVQKKIYKKNRKNLSDENNGVQKTHGVFLDAIFTFAKDTVLLSEKVAKGSIRRKAG